MSEELCVFGSIVSILLVFIMLKKRKKSIESRNVANAAAKSITIPKAPPPLPVRSAPSLPPRCPSLRALDYPKCPIDRSRNEPGKPQVIFWDSVNNSYICCHGHRFTGRE